VKFVVTALCAMSADPILILRDTTRGYQNSDPDACVRNSNSIRQVERAMTPTRLMNVAGAVILLALTFPCTAGAEGKMSDMEGEWSGSGTERDTPFQSMQRATCQSKIRADLKRMSNEITCTMESGVRKTMHMQVTLEGTRLTGDLTQTRTVPRQPVQSRKGSVLGTRVGNSANVQIQFPGMTPTATSRLTVVNASSYTLRVEALGAVMMDLTFKRVGPPKEEASKAQPPKDVSEAQPPKEATQATQAQ